MKNKSDKIILYMLFVGILGMFIGSFYDLEINKLLYSRGDIFPNIFKIFGEFPMIIIITTASLLYIRKNFKDKNLILILMLIVYITFPIGSSLGIPKYFDNNNIIYILLIYFFYITISYLLSQYFINKLNKNDFNYLIFVVLSIVSIFIVFNLMKNIWGRPRFFTMQEINNFSNFKNWWIINVIPKSDLFRSFPSGHTSAAASTLVVCYMPQKNKIKFNNIIYFYFPIIWTFLVAVSRIYDGAHFLTDVSFAIILSSVVILIMKKLILNKK